VPSFRAFNDQKVSEDVVQKLNQLVIDAIGKQVTATYVKDLKAVWNILTCQYNSSHLCLLQHFARKT
jgi:ppGpp synthetase/RelA/SpoT-type nucleotidyltranferase